jgi:hypothetical protein
MAAPVFMTCWKSRERLATPVAETRDVQTAAHAHDDRTNLYGEITDKITAVLKADRVCIEPHTDPNVPLGTVEVRQYLGKLPVPRAPLSLDAGLLARTTRPENRYSGVLFVEKEEFNALLAQAWIAERFYIAFISTKGMSQRPSRTTSMCRASASSAPSVSTVAAIVSTMTSTLSTLDCGSPTSRRWGWIPSPSRHRETGPCVLPPCRLTVQA